MEFIDYLWDLVEYDKERTKENWNSRAKQYSESDNRNEHNINYELLASKFESPEKCRVLDIGCADGKHSRVFAKYFSEIVGIDISANLIEFARLKSEKESIENTKFIEASWEDLDIDEMGFRSSFDLVISNFSPAIHSEESVLKICDVSRAYCYISQHVGRNIPLKNEMLEKFGGELQYKLMKDKMIASFNTLWFNGYLPSLNYDKRTAFKLLTEENIDDFCEDFEDRDGAINYLKKRLVNGKLEYKIEHTNGILIWSV
ncbi:MAG: class I SAM-dependent methyltransferase [Tissierellia bacterium]|nr:class I SAM-dependent methyltransferase [Tissierellia bacterium]